MTLKTEVARLNELDKKNLPEPRKGNLYIIKGAKPKHGYKLCAFQERRDVGCQLHGELNSYEYVFRVLPDKEAYIYVSTRAGEGVRREERISDLYSKITPYHPDMMKVINQLWEENQQLNKQLSIDSYQSMGDIMERDELLERAREALDRIAHLDGEINVGNYTYDEVEYLNNQFIETYYIAKQALEKINQQEKDNE